MTIGRDEAERLIEYQHEHVHEDESRRIVDADEDVDGARGMHLAVRSFGTTLQYRKPSQSYASCSHMKRRGTGAPSTSGSVLSSAFATVPLSVTPCFANV